MIFSFVLSLFVAVSVHQAPPQSAPGPDVETCLSCHSDRGMSVTLPDGETRGLFIDRAVFDKSVHGGKLACVDCHSDMSEVPHPARPFKTRREFTVAYYEACKRCHFANYSKTLDSVHHAAQARGDVMAPVCVDCHGSHDITPPSQPRSRISQTCAKCHEGVQATYVKSVHGTALFEEKNGDVPVCTDCHRSHDVGGPRAPGWRLKSPELCATCHTNEKLMKKYGVSTNVMSTFLADFHGMTASLHKTERTDAGVVTALCIDCHGVHDITKVTAKNSPVMKANLQKVCQRCHPNAPPNFSAAWMSHYEPTFDKAPLVYSVKVFYAILIPFMIGGLVLQILLHLWRVVVNR